MASEAQLFQRLADAFGDAARANERIAQAFAQLAETRPAAAATAPAPPAKPARSAPALKLPVDDDEPEGDADDASPKGAQRKILTALAQQGRPLTPRQIGAFAAIAHRGGAVMKAMARLREHGWIINVGAGVVQITGDGLVALGPFARLPEGLALFEFWCNKVDNAAADVLRALRRVDGGPLSNEQIGEATGRADRGGAFMKKMAKLRRLELIEGPSSANMLSESLRQAIEPTIGVHDMKTGRSIRVKAR